MKLSYEDKGTASDEQLSTAAGVTTALGGTTARGDDSASSAYVSPLHFYSFPPVVSPGVSVPLDPKVGCEVGVGVSSVGTDVAERLDDGSLSSAQRANFKMDTGKGPPLKRASQVSKHFSLDFACHDRGSTWEILLLTSST